MDAFNRSRDVLTSAWRSLPPSQRLATSLVALAVLGGLTALGLSRSATQYVPLSLGSASTADDVDAIEQTLRARQLTGFRRDGTRLLVPAERIADFDAALRESESGPANWAADWEQKVYETNPFTSSQELRALKEIALAKELRRIILDLEGVEDASVVWADSDGRVRWGTSRRRVTATVNVRPAQGIALPPATIRGIQFSVAHMVPDLQPEDVVVFDLSAGRHFQLDPAEARFETELAAWREEQFSAWTARIERCFAESWPAAEVQISIDDPKLRELAKSLAADRAAPPQSAALPRTSANKPLQLDSGTVVTAEPLPTDGTEKLFRAIQVPLAEQFPQVLRVSVTFPDEAMAELTPPVEFDGWDSAAGTARLQELHTTILNDLPVALPPASLRVAVETGPAAASASQVAEPLTISPGLLLLAIGGCLAAFGLAWRSMTTRPAVPVVHSAEPAEHLSAAVPPEPISGMSPLGDPETVALVLQNWLSRSDAPDRPGSKGL